MKRIISVAALSTLVIAATSTSAFAFYDHIVGGATLANAKQLVCTTPLSQWGAQETVIIPPHDVYYGTLHGSANGGMAHFVREIGPYSVKISYEADSVIYSNDEEGVELIVTTSPMGGKLRTLATFKEGKGFPAVSMSCHLELP